MNFITHAKVELTIEVSASSSWGQDCTCAQVVDQAIQDAKGLVQRLAKDHVREIAIIGRPVVTIVTASLKE